MLFVFLLFLFSWIFETSHNQFCVFFYWRLQIKKKFRCIEFKVERGGNGYDANNGMNINAQRRGVIMMPDGSSLNNMTVWSPSEVTVTVLLC